MTITRRILSHVEQPDLELPELDWINGRVRLLGESFGQARTIVQGLIKSGRLRVVREEPINVE